jgi:hypothetical protein
MEARSVHRLGMGGDRRAAIAAGALGVVLVVLVAEIAVDLTIAVRSAEAVAVDPSPSDGWPSAGVAMLALVIAGFGLAFTGPFMHVRLPNAVLRALAAVNGAAVLFVLGRALTYDVYGGSATRYISVDPARPAWIVVLALLALLTTAVARRFPGVGLFLSGLFLWLCALSGFLEAILLD